MVFFPVNILSSNDYSPVRCFLLYLSLFCLLPSPFSLIFYRFSLLPLSPSSPFSLSPFSCLPSPFSLLTYLSLFPYPFSIVPFALSLIPFLFPFSLRPSPVSCLLYPFSCPHPRLFSLFASHSLFSLLLSTFSLFPFSFFLLPYFCLPFPIARLPLSSFSCHVSTFLSSPFSSRIFRLPLFLAYIHIPVWQQFRTLYSRVQRFFWQTAALKKLVKSASMI
jgi:hypothetical protein